MDKTILKEFIKQTKPKNVKKYAEIVTEMLTDEQMVKMQELFQMKLTLRAYGEKASEEPENEPESKPEFVIEKRQPITKETPDYIDEEEPKVEEKAGDSTSAEELGSETPLTDEDIKKMNDELS